MKVIREYEYNERNETTNKIVIRSSKGNEIET